MHEAQAMVVLLTMTKWINRVGLVVESTRSTEEYRLEAESLLPVILRKYPQVLYSELAFGAVGAVPSAACAIVVVAETAVALPSFACSGHMHWGE